jgi:hypothetical protein
MFGVGCLFFIRCSMFDVHLFTTSGVRGSMMEPTEIAKLKALDEQIQIIKTAALELKNLSGGVQAADCNADRILASAKMLEINFSDLLTVL